MEISATSTYGGKDKSTYKEQHNRLNIQLYTKWVAEGQVAMLSAMKRHTRTVQETTVSLLHTSMLTIYHPALKQSNTPP